jgi:high-affinity nickel permease
VEQAEEQVLVHMAAADVEGRTNVLLHQRDDADRRGVGEFSSLLFSSSFVYISFLIVNGISCVSEVTMELEGLRTMVDTFLDYLGVSTGTREDRI